MAEDKKTVLIVDDEPDIVTFLPLCSKTTATKR